MCRVAYEIQARWLVGENVPGIINWSKGVVFEQVQADLEAAGFEAFPPVILPACGLDAPHRRERVWFIAHRNSDGCGGDHQLPRLNSKKLEEGMEEGYVPNPLHGDGDASDTGRLSGDRRAVDKSRSSERHGNDSGREEETDISQRRGTSNTPSDAGSKRHRGIQSDGQPRSGKKVRTARDGNSKIIADPNSSEQSEGGESSPRPQEAERHTGLLDARGYEFGTWDNFPTQSPLCGGDDGISNRVDRLKSLGNAIVPEVAYQIFQIIQYMDKLLHG